jgi:hypothetical protein
MVPAIFFSMKKIRLIRYLEKALSSRNSNPQISVLNPYAEGFFSPKKISIAITNPHCSSQIDLDNYRATDAASSLTNQMLVLRTISSELLTMKKVGAK